ncbi:MAG: cobaltochelatase subunit CobN [Pseudomonadota bacterium]
MHLLNIQSGSLSEESEPVDFGQDPADIIIISAADTELAGLSEAYSKSAKELGITLRLANLMHFSHPFSVDHYLEQTVTKSRLVIARILGGEAYWQYSLEQFSKHLQNNHIPFITLPGDDKQDQTLQSYSSVSEQDYNALWSYFTEGGLENFQNLLHYAKTLVEHPTTKNNLKPPPAKPLLKAGLYAPKTGMCDLISLQQQNWTKGQTTAAIVFYRALVQGGGLDPVNQICQSLQNKNINPLPIFVTSLKDEVSAATLEKIFQDAPPDIVLNATSFALSKPQTQIKEYQHTILDRPGVPVLQVTFSGSQLKDWTDNLNGLSARDIAMNVALPECDGRIFTRAVSFKDKAYYDTTCQCPITTYKAEPDRIEFVTQLAKNWITLSQTPAAQRRIAIILANYPNKDGRLANGVGLDTPASVLNVFENLKKAGYDIENIPKDTKQLMAHIQAAPTNWLTDRYQRQGGENIALSDYLTVYQNLPKDTQEQMENRWGLPQDDPFFNGTHFVLSLLRFGNCVLGIQPARGYNIDPKATYHDPDLIPPHNYLAFYIWLNNVFGCHAVIHMGKHGNLEWLPGKSIALSKRCFPEIALGPMPHIYPFIVNDPGEGTQAKRRAQAVIIDHLTPPLTRAETYGPLKDLEALVDEYYQAATTDQKRLKLLTEQILTLTSAERLDQDIGISAEADLQTRLDKIDTFLCEIKESQIRDGLHVFGQTPDKDLTTPLVSALARLPRNGGVEKHDQSLIRTLAQDLNLAHNGFDPLDCDLAKPWHGSKPGILKAMSPDLWRTNGDTVERLELLALQLIKDETPLNDWSTTQHVMDDIKKNISPAVEKSGTAEITGLLTALEGKFVPPGPSGAPTRGRLDVLPTGRNFFSLDSRTLPTPTAYTLGKKSAELLVERHLQDEGDWLKTATLSMWGTSNMRTGGDDIAQAMALMGVKPTWDFQSYRVTGYEIIPLGVLNRPRVDVTIRISGLFRDAFPAQIDLLDKAARAIMTCEEPEEMNPAAARYKTEKQHYGERAGARIFGSKPGAYGAGLQTLIDEKIWNNTTDFAESYLAWGSYTYGQKTFGTPARDLFETRLKQSNAVIHNQDNREHDILDSDDYYQFEGGLSATIEHLQGTAPKIYHNDHSRPECPVIHTLDEEISRVMRARVANPKWINGVMRHGYKGAFEIAATVDYLFAFAATTKAVKNHHFDIVYQEFIENEDRATFIKDHNPAAFADIKARLSEAIERGLWQPHSNRASFIVQEPNPKG